MPILPPNFQESLVAWYRGQSFPSPPTTLWLALFSVVPTGDSGGTELSGGGYARKSIATASVFVASGSGRTVNGTAIVFATSSGVVGEAFGAALMSAATGGTRRFIAALDASRVINTNDALTIPAGALSIDFTNV